MKYFLSLLWVVLIFSCEQQKETAGTFVNAAEIQLCPPNYTVDSVFFKEKATLKFSFSFADAEIRYTTDGSEVTTASAVYSNALQIDKTSTIKAKVFHKDYQASDELQFDLSQLKYNISDADITMAPAPAGNYTANGSKSLVDFKTGSTQFGANNQWLGFNKSDVVFNFKLSQELALSKVMVHLMTAQNSWIFSPHTISVISNTELIGFYTHKNAGLKSTKSAETNFIEIPISPGNYKAFTLVIHCLDKIPDWHAAAGKTPWLFIDEIIVE